MTEKPSLHLLIAAPRGFCAGVDRAIRIVELALEKYGAPVYVRHEIVHNAFVVNVHSELFSDRRRFGVLIRGSLTYVSGYDR